MSRLPVDIVADQLFSFLDRRSIRDFATTSRSNAKAAATNTTRIKVRISKALRAEKWPIALLLIRRAAEAIGSWSIDGFDKLEITPENRDSVFALVDCAHKNTVSGRIAPETFVRVMDDLARHDQTDAMYESGKRSADMHMVRRASDKGHADASMYLWKQPRDDDDDDMLRRAYDQGHIRAPLYLSDRDEAKAPTYLQEGVDRGCARAMFKLSGRYATGLGVPHSAERSRELFERGVDADPTESLALLACEEYLYQTNLVPNPAEAIDRLRYAQARGNEACTALLASFLRDGTHVEADIKEAVRILEEAVAVPSVVGPCRVSCSEMLADIYARGLHGVPKDGRRALELAMRTKYGRQTVMFLLAHDRAAVLEFFEAERSGGIQELCDMCVAAAECGLGSAEDGISAGHFLESMTLHDKAYVAFCWSSSRDRTTLAIGQRNHGTIEAERMRRLDKVSAHVAQVWSP